MKLFWGLLGFGIFLQGTTGCNRGASHPKPRCDSGTWGGWSACVQNKCRETQSRSKTICGKENRETRQCYPTQCQGNDFCCPKNDKNWKMKLFWGLLGFGIFLQGTTGCNRGASHPKPRCDSGTWGGWSACVQNKCRETQSRSKTICGKENRETRQCYPTQCQGNDFCCPKNDKNWKMKLFWGLLGFGIFLQGTTGCNRGASHPKPRCDSGTWGGWSACVQNKCRETQSRSKTICGKENRETRQCYPTQCQGNDFCCPKNDKNWKMKLFWGLLGFGIFLQGTTGCNRGASHPKPRCDSGTWGGWSACVQNKCRETQSRSKTICGKENRETRQCYPTQCQGNDFCCPKNDSEENMKVFLVVLVFGIFLQGTTGFFFWGKKSHRKKIVEPRCTSLNSGLWSGCGQNKCRDSQYRTITASCNKGNPGSVTCSNICNTPSIETRECYPTQCQRGDFCCPQKCEKPIPNCKKMRCNSAGYPECETCKGFSNRGAEFSIYYPNGRKSCIPTCSEESNSCWPGSCGKDHLPRSCRCNPGFKLMKFGSATKCELEKKPQMFTCTMGASENGEKKNSTSVKCKEEDDVFINFKPENIYFKTEAMFSWNLNFTKPSHVKNFSVGIVGGEFSVEKVSTSGNKKKFNTVELTEKNVCNKAFNEMSPSTEKLLCDKSIHLSNYTINHGDKLCVTFTVFAGGYLILNKIGSTQHPRKFYQKTNSNVTKCFVYDILPPKHCIETRNCPQEPIQLTSRVTKSENISVSFDGWSDSIPQDKSTIELYDLTVHEVTKMGEGLGVNRMKTFSNFKSANQTMVDVKLPRSPALFALYLTVKDLAGNSQNARGFVLFDNSSKIETRPTNRPRVLVATGEEDPAPWYTRHKDVCITWKGYFRNSVLQDKLRPIKKDPSIIEQYDQTSGILNTDGTWNVDGISEFHYRWRVNKVKLSATYEYPQNRNLSACIRQVLEDGDRLTVWITAIDLLDRNATTNISLLIDRSGPVIEDIGLIKGGHENVYIHNSTDLSEMVLKLKAMDKDSGLKRVQWRLGSTIGGNDIGNGGIAVVVLSKEETCPPESCCYCLVATGKCQMNNFTLTLNSLVKNGTNKGQHNRRYYFAFRAENNAGLQSEEHFTIAVDESPPEVGIVLEGPSAMPDMDFTGERTISVHWDGFIDHESGISHYLVAVADKCIGKELQNGCQNCNLSIPLVSTEETITRLRFPSPGKYFTTVVAFNFAMEPSVPVCSDGIVFDKTPPRIVDVSLSGAKTLEDIVCNNGEVWRINSDLTKSPLNNSTSCTVQCDSSTAEKLIDFLKESQADETVNQNTCPPKRDAPEQRFIGIPSDTIHLAWNYEESETELLDFYVGIGSDVSAKQHPDLIGYTSTNQKSEFRKHHLGIDAGVNFYVFISAINRAMISQTVTLGPIIIDQSPPRYQGNINVSVGHDTLTLLWSNNTFYDPQQKAPFTFYYHIKNVHTKEFVTPLQRYNGQTLYENGLASIKLPLQLRNNKQPHSTIYVCELHVFNMVGLFTTVISPEFQITVDEPFDYGKVIDIDPNIQSSTNDIDFHNQSNTACVRLDGFRDDVRIQVGIGTTPHLANVVNYQLVTNRSTHCIQEKTIESFRTYYAVSRVSFQGKTSIVASDGFAIISTNITDLIKVYIGECNMSKTIAMNINHKNNTNSYTLDIMEDLHIGQEYSVILNTVDPHAELSGNGLKPLGGRSFITGSKTYLTFMALSKRPLLRLRLKKAIRKPSVALSRCPFSQHFQKVTTKLSAYWTVSDRYVKYVTHFQAGIVDQTCMGSNGGQMCTLQDFRNIGRVFNITRRHLDLISGHTYSFSIRACMRAVGCTKRVFSPGIIVLNKRPIVGQLNARLNRIDNRAFIAIQWTGFSCISGSHVTNPVGYELAVTDSRGSELVAPKTISKDTSKNEFTYQYNITNLPPGKVNVGLVTFCLSSLSTKITTLTDEVQERKFDTGNDVCIYEYDANIRVADQQNWTKNSFPLQRFCSLKDADSVALATGRIGAGMVGHNIEIETWYLMSVAQTPDYGCSEDRYCVRSAIGQAGDNSVQFDVKGLKAENFYFVCARGTKYRISGELQHFNVCGNGFWIDGTLPEKGQVRVENTFNGFVSDHSLVVSWQGFTDQCKQCSQLFNPKIASYSYFIGTYPKQEDIAVSKDVGRRSHVVLKNLSIADGQKIFVGIRAYDLSGQSVETISGGVIVDRSPPLTGTLYTGSVMAHDYYVDTNELTIYWNGFLDEHSEISSYQLGIGSRQGQDDVIPFQEQHLDFAEIQSKKLLLDGHEYYAILKVTNGAGLATTATSDSFRVDSSPPLKGVIMELSPQGLGDINYQRETTALYASWFDFSDPHTGVLFYRVGVGSLPLHDDVIAMASVGNKTDAEWHKDFVPGVKYYVTVEACNRAFLCSKTSSNGILMDNSAPLAGIVELGMNGQHPGYQAHRSLLNVRWAGFHDPHSGMQKFLYCIGTAPRLCDVLPWQSALQETSTVITGIQLSSNKLMYVTVNGFNNVGLNITASSSGFLVDDTPPIIQSKPRLLNSDNTEVTSEVMATADNSLLHVHWSFKDDESPIVEQFIRIHPHTSGMISLKNMRLPPLSKTTIQLKEKERLQDGSTYNISMTVCNAAGLCSSTISRQQILVDSTRPVMGKFLPDNLFWFQKHTFTCLNLTWDGFEDSESGIKRYHLFIRDSKGQFLTQPIIANHFTNQNQSLSVNLTRKLATSEFIILEIMAENGIGLFSKIFKITANLFCSSRVADFGYLDIQTHSCPIQYCNNDCTCASQGKKCDTDKMAKCKPLENTERQVKLRVQSVDDITASARCLSAHWTITDVKEAQRIEWSVGINGSEIGTGIFNLLKENPWQDVGIQDHVVYCLPSEQTLETGEWYAFYLRVWYSFDEYAIFTSENSVQVDLTSPIVRRGARISDAIGSCNGIDVDYINKVETIGACWKKVFLDVQSNIDRYIVMAGTAPSMGDLIKPLTIAVDKTRLFKKVNLNKGTKYYFTVIAINSLGLFTILHSNGFVYDDEPPTNGIVYNTDSYRNSPHQNLQDSFGISWHGFQDAHSAIQEYQVAMALEGSDPSKIHFTSAGMATSYTFPGVSAKHNENYVGYVKAVDAAGHTSDIIQSKVVCVDKTPPEPVGCEIFSQVLTKEYNERQPNEQNRGRFSGGEFGISVNLTFNEFYELKFTIPSNSENQNTMLLIGNETMNVPFTISGPTSVLQHRFLSQFEGTTNISLKFFACKSYPKTLKLSLSKCTSGKNSSISVINLKQISPTLILASFNVFDKESGIKQVSIGAGTTLGGFQINRLRKMSSSHGPHIIYSMSLPHGQVVYVTFLIENWAGLESVITKQLVIDHTPSRIDIKSSFLYYEERKENVIETHWKVVDEESKVEECYYGIGTKSGSIDVNDWTISPSNHSIRKIVKSADIVNGSLYLTVMCTNKANLLSRKVTKLNLSPKSERSIPELKFHIIPTNTWSGVNYSSHIQSDPNQLNMQIDQYGCSDDVHVCRILEDGKTLVDWIEIGHRYHFTLQNLTLQQGEKYQVEIKNVNNEKMKSRVTKSIIIDSSRPKLTGSLATIEKQSPSSFKMQWNKVFETSQFQNIRYMVSIGTAKATTNIVHQRETSEMNTMFHVNNPGRIYVSLTAVYETALFTTYSQEFNI